MNIFDRYLSLALLRGIALCLLVLVLLISLAALVQELKDVGEGRYDMLQAIIVVVLRIPERAFTLAPVATLVGAILGLGGLAAHHEITAMRAAGLSPIVMAGTALKAALPILIIMVILMQWVIPPLSQEAGRRKRIRLEGPGATITDENLWLRDENVIVRIGSLEGTDGLNDVQIFRMGKSAQLEEVVEAQSGTIESDGHWSLTKVQRSLIPGSGVKLPIQEFERIPSPLRKQALDLILTPPDHLPVTELYEQINSLEPSEQRLSLTRVLWRKISAPLLVCAMLLLSIPFVFRSAERGSTGMRIALGVLIGVFAHLGTQVADFLGSLTNLPPAMLGLTPAILVTALALALIARLS